MDVTCGLAITIAAMTVVVGTSTVLAQPLADSPM
jgi:hypothetical protein